MFTVEIPQSDFVDKLLAWGSKFSHFALYPGNGYADPYQQYDLLFAAGAKQIIAPETNTFATLHKSWKKHPTWLFGYLSYDVKNELEKLESSHIDAVGAPRSYFFEPQIVGFLREGKLFIKGDFEAEDVFNQILAATFEKKPLSKLTFNSRLSREEYLHRVKALQQHIQQGDIYEVNFCQEFYAEKAEINPEQVFAALNQKANPPFAAFLNLPQHAVMCASPERYLQKNGTALVSQPIKGTARRSNNPTQDEHLKTTLHNSTKERAENVMIVDLVRNDLSRVATMQSVQVPELFWVHTYPTVHQLVSTVTADLAGNKTWADALSATFPMGSMTGAPKVRAMQLIEEFEAHRRGIYSGAIGYITPQGNFDFNVVIRTLLYNKTNGYLSASVGSAITILANAEAEYDECLLKAEALLGLF